MTASLDARAILFDLDGVLVDSTQCVEHTWRAWAQNHGLDGDMIVRYAHGRRATETVAHVAPHLMVSDEVAALAHSEANEARGVYPIEGAATLLRKLPPAQWAIVTSGVRAVATFRIALGGLPTPNVLLTADDVGRGKPDPEGYLRAATLLGIPPADCVVIEDAPAGVTAARAAGMRAIGVSSTFAASTLHDADFVIGAVSELVVEVRGAALRIGVPHRTDHGS
jgi:mannitol-1-/sugar-/sorbitol-6-phosphatase